MAGGFVGVDLFLASGRLLGSCALSVRCSPGNTGQDTIGFGIEIEIVQQHFHQWYCLQPTQTLLMPKCSYNLFNSAVVPLHLTVSLRVES